MKYTIVGLLDNNPQIHGTSIYGSKIMPFRTINSLRYDLIVLATPFYADMVKQLTALGVDNSKLIRLGASYSFGCSIFETHIAQQRLTNHDFTLISNDCWGGILYSWLGIQFRTPFINLIVPPGSYITLAQDLDYFLGQDLRFPQIEQQGPYPVGALDDIRIHFVHDQRNRRLKKNGLDGLNESI